MIKKIISSVYEPLTSHRYCFFSLYCIFFLILTVCFIAWPVVGYDTDLWYHLTGGRYFWENLKIPSDAFFSYIAPQKSWYNYYWLFQVIIYKTYQWGGYYGLIIIRCLIFVASVYFISRLLIDRNADQRKLLIGAAFLVAYAMSLTVRELLVRPHLFSYLFIILFLYILEIERGKIWSLPLLGILWCNIHGIEFPVMIIILLAYLMDLFYQEIRNPSASTSAIKKEKWLLIITIYSLFITPGVIELMKTPFTAASYQQFYVAELIPLDINNLLRFSVWPSSELIGTFQNILILLPFVLFVLCLVKKKLRVSFVILLIAAIALLIKHNRFVYEYILLSIPLIRQSIKIMPEISDSKKKKLAEMMSPIFLVSLLVVLPLMIYGSHFRNRPEYPLAQIQLPVGVAKFLNHLDAGGAVMNESNTGGYLQWALNKKYKIFMDMQMSIFSDQDFAFINNALHDEATFLTFIRTYDPSFISVALDRQNFSKWINNHKEYKQVFFDDSEVLYVNSNHYPQIAKKYAFKQFNVFEYKTITFEKETKERLSAMLGEVLKVRNIHPGSGIANVVIANIMMADKRYNESLMYADSIIKHYPNIAKGYILKADALRGLERVPEAIENYLLAIDRGLKTDESKVYWNLHTCYGHLKMYKKAYGAISKFLNPFDPEANYRDIYALGISAATAGKKRDAVNFLKIAQFKVPPEDEEYTKKIKYALAELDSNSR